MSHEQDEFEAALLEILAHTRRGRQLFEQGFKEGFEQGFREGRQSLVLKVLTTRFGPVPASIREGITRVHDLRILEALLTLAGSASSMDMFMRALG